MTELVGHSLLSKVPLHLSEYSLLFPLLHILIHVLAQKDIHQMERKIFLLLQQNAYWILAGSSCAQFNQKQV